MKLIDKIKKSVQEKLDVFEFMKLLCPFELDFSLKIIANIKTTKGNKYDYGIFIKPLQGTGLFEDPRDIQALIVQILAERKIKMLWKVARAKFEDEEYIAIYLSKLKEG